jgi:uncharacterized protein YndB with AHSA1/START domain
MFKAEYEFDLPVPPARAFAVLSDPERDPEWQSACVAARLLNGEARPGCRYEITFELIGKRMQFTVEIDEFVPGQRSKFHSLDGPFQYVGTYTYTEPVAGSTHVRWEFEVEPGRFFGITPIPLLRKVLVNQVRKDSARLADELSGARQPRP